MRGFGASVNCQVLWALLAIAGLVASGGCGSGDAGPTGTVSGTVTLNGQPVPPGSTVSFISEKGQTAAGVVEDEGEYQLYIGGEDKYIPVGAYKATVAPPAEEMTQAEYDAMMEAASSQKRPSRPPAQKSLIPVKYQMPATSGLSFNVEEGSNQIDIKLDDTGPAPRTGRR